PGQVDVAPPGQVDVAPPGQVDVAPPGRVDVAPPGRVDVAPSGQVDVALPGSGADRALPGPTPGPVGAVQPQGLPGAKATKPAGVAAPPDQKQMQPVVAPPAPRVETAPVRPSERPQGQTSTRPAPTKSAPSVAALKARVEKLRASLVDSSKRLILEKRVAPRLAGPLTEKQRVELAEQLDDLSP
ncbi:MAG: hypothetical protein INH37_16780, partial [Myxococcaceae bacterium]|nr:hypothetical protein [Myxococcaceae bacterium]